MSSSTSNESNPPTGKFPLREIPGDYGRPFFGPIRDRWDYFYCQGKDEFFKSRIQKYNSTVIRCNMPPGPFICSADESKVVAVLDSVSFTILFDTSKVEKKDVLDGTFMPSLSLFGGYRVCAFLDPSEPKHHTLKSLCMALLASTHKTFIPNFRSNLSEMFLKLDAEIAREKSADFNALADTLAFDFIFSLFSQKRPSDTKLGSSGPGRVTRWVAVQLAPLGTSGFLPGIFEDFIHTVRIPSFLVKSDYDALYDAVHTACGSVLDEAEKLHIPREDACHNVIFMIGFNAFGGLKILLPTLIKWVAAGGEFLHKNLREEIRGVLKSEGGGNVVTLSALEKMVLTKSVVYETLRIEPPVPFQYAKAKEDIVVDSHDGSYLIKKGEMIFGYQPMATKDPKVFENPEQFVWDRFVGEKEKLIKYVYWSNGRETDAPTADDKQCPGKDLVVLLCRLLLVEFFLHYDTFTAVAGENVGLGPPVKIKSLVLKPN